MTSTYDRQGIQFLYPENWKLTDDDMGSVPRTVSVQAPSGAFWSVDIHPFSISPDELLTQTLKIMREEYTDLESQPVTRSVGNVEANGYDLSFWCLDFVVSCQLRAFSKGHATYLLTYQAEDREFGDLQAVFEAMTHSLLQEEEEG